MQKLLMLFIDGLGLGLKDPESNPIHSGACPFLAKLLEEKAVGVDASLGVAGIPQSATGTTTLLTGINAAALLGRHVEGFPGPTLRSVIEKENIFLKLRRYGLSAAFANAYGAHSLEEVVAGRLLSATTVASLSGLGSVRLLDDLIANQAVYHDLTRERLLEKGFRVPLVSAADAACHLANLAADHNFTLFEYFLTDRAGHAAGQEEKKKVLSRLDGFLGTLLPLSRRLDFAVILSSDHGNIEDAQSTAHTLNPVPFVVVGKGEDELRSKVRNIADIVPVMLDWFGVTANASAIVAH